MRAARLLLERGLAEQRDKAEGYLDWYEYIVWLNVWRESVLVGAMLGGEANPLALSFGDAHLLAFHPAPCYHRLPDVHGP